MLPSFLVVGAPRSATTSLHFYLRQHPDICLSRVKEPNFFLFGPQHGRPVPFVAPDRRIVAKSVTQESAYERLFSPGAARAVGEVSPLYLYTEQTPGRIASMIPRAKIVAVLREPVDRAWSHFRYVTGLAHDQALEPFLEHVQMELPLADAPYRPGTHYLRLGRYAHQVRRYTELFDPERIRFLSYRPLIESPAERLRELCRFLDVDDSFTFDLSTRYNPATAGQLRRSRLDRVTAPLRPTVKRLLPKRVVGPLAGLRAESLARHADPPAPPPRAAYDALRDYYAADNAWLRDNLGVTFDAGMGTPQRE